MADALDGNGDKRKYPSEGGVNPMIGLMHGEPVIERAQRVGQDGAHPV